MDKETIEGIARIAELEVLEEIKKENKQTETKGEAFERFGKRIEKAEIKLGQAYRNYYKEREEAEKELQKVLGEINETLPALSN